jgi:superfamily II DNA or RNA helicase
MDKLPPRNSTKFPLAATTAISRAKPRPFLLPHQTNVVSFFSEWPDARGILVAHETGTGKTINSVAIAEALKPSGRRIVVLAAKSLHNNYRANVVKFLSATTNKSASDIADIAGADYNFVSTNASNMAHQLAQVSKPAELQQAIDEELGSYESSAAMTLNGCTIIVDEAHDLFNSIVNGSTNGTLIYGAIMRSNDIRLVFMTSNVMINSPFELVPCFNMLAGTDLFPTSYTAFMDFFVDERAGKMKNRDQFKSRIYGLVSYYGSWYQTAGALSIRKSVVRENMPTRLPIKELRIPMTKLQYGLYSIARDKERDQKSFGAPAKTAALRKPKGSASSTYRIRTRQFSNIGVDEFDGDNPPNLDLVSSKWAAMCSNISKHAARPGLVFSPFVNTYGIKWFARCLPEYSEYKFGDKAGSRRYAFFTGSMNFDERDEVLKVFNSKENERGEIIHLLMGSPAMSQGIDTKRICHVHIMSPAWHYSAMDQIIARAVRHNSHADMPENERTVQPYIYMSDHPADTKIQREPTTDVIMYTGAIKKKLINDQFFGALIEASIDCVHHLENSGSARAKKNIKCMLCVPDNRRLYESRTDNIANQDITCRPIVAKRRTLKSMTFAAREYYYSDKGGRIHVYTEVDGNYIPLAPSSKLYAPIFAAIQTKK